MIYGKGCLKILAGVDPVVFLLACAELLVPSCCPVSSRI